jgi:hypothetical protein
MLSVSDTKPMPPPLEILGRRDQLLQRPGEPIEFPHDQHVALAQHVIEDAREFGPVRFGARHLLGVDLLAARSPERVELQLGRLVGGADPGVPDPHPGTFVLETHRMPGVSERSNQEQL